MEEMEIPIDELIEICEWCGKPPLENDGIRCPFCEAIYHKDECISHHIKEYHPHIFELVRKLIDE